MSKILSVFLSEFNYVLPLDEQRFDWLLKIEAIPHSPFRLTLFLDTDTFVCGDISNLQLLGASCELAIAHAPLRDSSVSTMHHVPASFSELNTGVILFLRNDRTFKLFQDWKKIYVEQSDQWTKAFHDQPAFRSALLINELKWATLTPEYNCRFIRPGYLQGEVKILHGRDQRLDRIAEILNASKKARIHLPTNEGLKVFEQTFSIPSNVTANLSELGVIVKSGV